VKEKKEKICKEKRQKGKNANETNIIKHHSLAADRFLTMRVFYCAQRETSVATQLQPLTI